MPRLAGAVLAAVLAAEPGGLVISNTCANCSRLTLKVVDLSYNNLEGPLPEGTMHVGRMNSCLSRRVSVRTGWTVFPGPASCSTPDGHDAGVREGPY